MYELDIVDQLVELAERSGLRHHQINESFASLLSVSSFQHNLFDRMFDRLHHSLQNDSRKVQDTVVEALRKFNDRETKRKLIQDNEEEKKNFLEEYEKKTHHLDEVISCIKYDLNNT